ncbi:hypothetical protein [Halomonas sp. A29]|uniref:hypothetical protein n=1 Tax=Halomonas sp. A29 TaxID=3102786 RepID=UPI00398AE80C
MSNINVIFNVPTWVETGLKSGQLHLFGGVIRDNAGKIVYHLKGGVEQAAKSGNGKVLIAVGAVTALAVGGYFIYKKFNKKEAASGEGEKLQEKMSEYLIAASQQDFSLANIQALSKEISTFMKSCDAAGISPDKIFADRQIAIKFKEVYDALVDFNSRLARSKEVTYEHPLNIGDNSAQILRGISKQLNIQKALIHEQ